jgi:hypothetical protein
VIARVGEDREPCDMAPADRPGKIDPTGFAAAHSLAAGAAAIVAHAPAIGVRDRFRDSWNTSPKE